MGEEPYTPAGPKRCYCEGLGTRCFQDLRLAYLNKDSVTMIGLCDDSLLYSSSLFRDSMGVFSRLEGLSIRGCMMGSLPSGICRIQTLRYLEVRASYGFTTLPDSIALLKNLKELWIWNQEHLDSIPLAIGGCSSLEIVWCIYNNLAKFPEGLTNAPALTHLNLSYNWITTVPMSISRLKNTLIILDLSENPIPDSVFVRLQAQLPNTKIVWKDGRYYPHP